MVFKTMHDIQMHEITEQFAHCWREGPVIQSRSVRQSGQPIFPPIVDVVDDHEFRGGGSRCRKLNCGWLEKLAGKRIGPLSKRQSLITVRIISTLRTKRSSRGLIHMAKSLRKQAPLNHRKTDSSPQSPQYRPPAPGIPDRKGDRAPPGGCPQAIPLWPSRRYHDPDCVPARAARFGSLRPTLGSDRAQQWPIAPALHWLQARQRWA
jgi:hypothetical protein